VPVQLPESVRALVESPRAAALILDVDGTLAPIVERPEDARVPDETRAELVRLHASYGLVACLSGRAGHDAARVVGVPALTYVGEHGLELAPGAEQWAGAIAAFADSIRWPAERKPLTVAFHFRDRADPDAARAELEDVARAAIRAGLVARFGRKVLEIRPPIAADKGTAVELLLDRSGLDRALYAGDDTTDLDAFRAIGELRLGVRVAVLSGEAPPALVAAADLAVTGPAGVLSLLRCL
jgi:trehalose 6-phosphate phosphatase